MGLQMAFDAITSAPRARVERTWGLASKIITSNPSLARRPAAVKPPTPPPMTMARLPLPGELFGSVRGVPGDQALVDAAFGSDTK